MCNKINRIKTINRRISGIKIMFGKQNCVFITVSNIYRVIITQVVLVQSFTECIYYIESLFNSMDFNTFICCGDFNTSFERSNGQTECLNSFITRNNWCISWNHPVSKKDCTYTNLSLNQFFLYRSYNYNKKCFLIPF